MVIAKKSSLIVFESTGVPKLKAVQNVVARLKKGRVAGLKLATRHDLLQYCKELLLPAPTLCRQLITNPASHAATELMGRSYMCIPQAASQFSVDGACFTGPTQMQWVSQLSKLPHQFTLHIDGKYKLHHGVWILLTLGTHMLRTRGASKVCSLGNTFVPLVYLFCKNHESKGAYTRYTGNKHYNILTIHHIYTNNTYKIHTEYITLNTPKIHINVHFKYTLNIL